VPAHDPALVRREPLEHGHRHAPGHELVDRRGDVVDREVEHRERGRLVTGPRVHQHARAGSRQDEAEHAHLRHFLDLEAEDVAGESEGGGHVVDAEAAERGDGGGHPGGS
jgi:hypothetical protein